MGGLRAIMQGLEARDAVRGAAIVGEDGLVIHDALTPEADGEAVAALAVTTMRHAEQFGGAGRCGTLRTAVLDFGGGPAILSALGPGATLVVLAHPDRDLGPLLFELRTRRDTWPASSSNGLGSHPRGRLGHPVLAAVHPRPPQAAAPPRGAAQPGRGNLCALGGLHSAQPDSGRHRSRSCAGAHQPGPGSIPPTSWWSRAGVHRARAGLGDLEALRRDPSAAVLALHADWAVGDTGAFAAAAEAALLAARNHDRLVTVGIVPSRPETGYGYIVPGTPLGGSVRTVERFTEARRQDRARPDGGRRPLEQRTVCLDRGPAPGRDREHTPEIAPHLARLAEGDVPGFFSAVTPVSIDVGLLERSAVAVLPGHFDWDDIGTWEALTRVRSRDERGNVGVGPVTFFESGDCVAWSDGMPVVMGGVHDVIAVVANGRVLVIGAPARRSQADAGIPASRNPEPSRVTRLICLEPADPGAAWYPFTGARPIAELRAGAWRIRERWAGYSRGGRRGGDGRPRRRFPRRGLGRGDPPGRVTGPAIVARSDFAPAGHNLDFETGPRRLTHGEDTVAWFVGEGETWAGPHEEGDALPVEGILLAGAWDLITALEHLLAADCTDALAAGPEPISRRRDRAGRSRRHRLLRRPDRAGSGLRRAPRRGGAGGGRRGSLRHPARGSALRGPHTMLLGGAIRHSVFGPMCRIHGEVASSVSWATPTRATTGSSATA